MKIVITTLFGLESPTKGDLLDRGYDKEKITVNDGVVTLEGDFFDVARANMWVKHAERIFFEPALTIHHCPAHELQCFLRRMPRHQVG